MTPKERAWQRQVEQNEAWDGEEGIRVAAKRRFNAEYKANGPTIVTLYPDLRRPAQTYEFATRREAEKFADEQGNAYLAVRAKR